MRVGAGLRGAIITGDQCQTAQRMLGRVAGVACRTVGGSTMGGLAEQLEAAIASRCALRSVHFWIHWQTVQRNFPRCQKLSPHCQDLCSRWPVPG